jgi:hypothetical protein
VGNLKFCDDSTVVKLFDYLKIIAAEGRISILFKEALSKDEATGDLMVVDL